jgi:hypothetical protein
MTMNLKVNDPKMQSLLERLFENHSVRLIRDEHDEPWFVAKDICDCLELTNSRQAIRSLNKEDLASFQVTAGGQARSMTLEGRRRDPNGWGRRYHAMIKASIEAEKRSVAKTARAA